MHCSLISLEAPRQRFNIHHPQKTVSIEGNPRDKDGIYMFLSLFSTSYMEEEKQGDQITSKITKSVNDRAMKLFYVHSLICLITPAKSQAAMCSYLGDKYGINFFHHLAENPICLETKYSKCVWMFSAGSVKFFMNFYIEV